MIDGKTESWWKQQNITRLKEQAQLRGRRFTDLETKGGTIKRNGKDVKFKRFLKEHDLREFLKLGKL